ncbi:hypothetical protein ACFL6U_01780 [Planctomycetota bacterium]
MEAFFAFLNQLGFPFNFVIIGALFAGLGILIYGCYTAYLNYALKRDMVNKDMSAEEIERVISAGKDKPKN